MNIRNGANTFSSYTNLGPMTTAFEPPRSCFNHNLYSANSYIVDDFGLTCKYESSTSLHDLDSACWPPGWYSILHTTGEWKTPIYSPGLACPSGWVVGCSAAFSRRPVSHDKYGHSFDFGIGDLWSEVKPHETAVICCPPAFECQSAGIGCILNLQPDQPVTGLSWDSKCRANKFTTKAPLSSEEPVSAFGFTLIVPSGSTLEPTQQAPTTLGVAERSSKTHPTATKTAKAGSTLNHSASGDASKTETEHGDASSPTETGGNGAPKEGLSPVAKISIIAAIVVVGLIFIAAVVFWRKRRQRQPKIAGNVTQEQKDDPTAGHAMSDLSKKQPADLTGSTESLLAELPPAVVKNKAHELGPGQNHEAMELDSRSYTVELDSTPYSHAVELPG